MSSLFDRFKGRKELTSAEIAKERLKLVLVTDRSNLSPEKLEEMQREIILVIKRYIPINEMEVQINIEQRERKHYLVADVPLNRDPSYGALEAPEPPPDSDSWVDAESGARASAETDSASGATSNDEPSANKEPSSPADEDDETDVPGASS